MNLPFAEWLPQQRWYAGRSRELSRSRTGGRRPAARRPRPGAARRLLHRRQSSERYQVIVRWDTGPIDEYSTVATIGTDGDRTAYDALYDPAAAQYLLSLIDRRRPSVGDVTFTRSPTPSCRWTPRRGSSTPSRATPA